MKIINVSASSAIDEALKVLRTGGVILYPTDTLYGLGADALSNAAVEKIYTIKGREEKKPIHAILADVEMAERYAEVQSSVRTLAQELPKGQLTFILKKKNVQSGIAKGIDTFGFRIPDNNFCLALIRAFGGPITATSANTSGEESKRTVAEILDQLGERAHDVDLVIDAGELPKRKPSTVVDMSGAEPRILREGEIFASEIHRVLLEAQGEVSSI